MSRNNNEDYLFIMKEDNIESVDDIRREFYLKGDSHTLDLSWTEHCVFTNEEVRICKDFRDKLCYLLAALHEDTLVITIVKKLLSGITEVILPSDRYAYGFNFEDWQKRYGFTIEEFLTNKKYIVISDTKRQDIINIIDLGLFNWDAIETSSLIDDE